MGNQKILLKFVFMIFLDKFCKPDQIQLENIRFTLLTTGKAALTVLFPSWLLFFQNINAYKMLHNEFAFLFTHVNTY